MEKIIFGSRTLGQTRYCPQCDKKHRLAYRSQPDTGTVYVSGDRDERYQEELTCGHFLDTFIYADGTVISN